MSYELDPVIICLPFTWASPLPWLDLFPQISWNILNNIMIYLLHGNMRLEIEKKKNPSNELIWTRSSNYLSPTTSFDLILLCLDVSLQITFVLFKTIS